MIEFFVEPEMSEIAFTFGMFLLLVYGIQVACTKLDDLMLSDGAIPYYAGIMLLALSLALLLAQDRQEDHLFAWVVAGTLVLAIVGRVYSQSTIATYYNYCTGAGWQWRWRFF